MQLSGKILITGGTGSLGTAILERAEREKWDAQFSILARNETKMNITRARFPNVRCIVGDIRDGDWLHTVFPGHDMIVHAAAIKIVPVAESNPREAVQTNVYGSLNVAQAAVDCNIPKVIGVSTDKVCGPTYYGLTKRLMEGIFRQAREWGDQKTDFVLCRYGNVLKSANSIVPFFQAQMKADKPFTITHMEMTRFWLSMRQAIDLIIETACYAHAGQIFVPQAKAAKVSDLADFLDPDREIVEIGIRAGERLHETLIVREEAMHTEHILGEFYDVTPLFVIQPPDIKPEWVALKRGFPVPFQYEYTSNNPYSPVLPEDFKRMLDES